MKADSLTSAVMEFSDLRVANQRKSMANVEWRNKRGNDETTAAWTDASAGVMLRKNRRVETYTNLLLV